MIQTYTLNECKQPPVTDFGGFYGMMCAMTCAADAADVWAIAFDRLRELAPANTHHYTLRNFLRSSLGQILAESSEDYRGTLHERIHFVCGEDWVAPAILRCPTLLRTDDPLLRTATPATV